MRYQSIIGLEIHVELKTKSKMFCGCSADYFGHKPNTHCCPVCLGLPGSLPVPNKKAIEWTVMVGLALNCEIPLLSKFDRKNYFYPDLPKGYQISQYDKPFAVDGKLNIKNQISKSKNITAKRDPASGTYQNSKIIRIRQVHLEEDTGKMIHTAFDPDRGYPCQGVAPQGEYTLIDFNRSGVPLMEIVTEPDLRSGDEAKFFLQKLQRLIRYLDVSECDMEKGSMRLEPNVSVKVKSQKLKVKSQEKLELPIYKVEIKNLNSFKFVKKAIDYEIERQIEILKRGKKIAQETRGWDEKKERTFSQRGKEEASNYRYFPEPDIPPIRWRKEEIKRLRNLLPELPDAKLNRFMEKFGLSEYDAKILTARREIADYFEEVVHAWQKVKSKCEKQDVKQIANWIINKRIDLDKVLPEELVETILKKLAPSYVSQPELEKTINQVILDNAGTVSDYKRGKIQAMKYLIGQVMSYTKGQADPKMAEEILKSKIDSSPRKAGLE